MLLAELRGRRPKRAGKAFLEYDDRCESPYRKGDVIVLPTRGDLQLYRLQSGWNQFVARLDYSTVWFGGTDENPFLVRIDDRPFREYCRYGPGGFYRSLIPTLPEKTYRRQGDIFACSIPFTWEEILKVYRYIHGWNVKVAEAEPDDRGRGLFGTRHHLTGIILNHEVHMPEVSIASSGSNPTWLVLVEGTVVAPDHSDMKLEGVYALAQTRYLHDPRVAD